MTLNPSEQYRAILAFLLLGLLCGALYDVVRILRVLCGLASYSAAGRAFREKRLPWIGSVYRPPRRRTQWLRSCQIAAGDIVFCLTAAVLLSVCLFDFGYGTLRWFYLVSCAVGFLAYRAGPGRLVMFFSETIAFGVRVALAYLYWIVRLPFRLAWRALRAAGLLLRRMLFAPLVRRLARRRRIAYTRRVQNNLLSTLQTMQSQ